MPAAVLSSENTKKGAHLLMGEDNIKKKKKGKGAGGSDEVPALCTLLN